MRVGFVVLVSTTWLRRAECMVMAWAGVVFLYVVAVEGGVAFKVVVDERGVWVDLVLLRLMKDDSVIGARTVWLW